MSREKKIERIVDDGMQCRTEESSCTASFFCTYQTTSACVQNNASRRYNSEKVKQMIERQKAKYGWEFLFLGANIDAVETASQFGIGADRAVNYQCDGEGTALNYEVVSEAISAVRCSAPLSADWKKRIDEDYKKRGGRKHK